MSAASRCLRSQPTRSIVDATTASSLSSSAKNLVRMTRWSSSLWDLKPSYTTSVDANEQA